MVWRKLRNVGIEHRIRIVKRLRNCRFSIEKLRYSLIDTDYPVNIHDNFNHTNPIYIFCLIYEINKQIDIDSNQP